MVRSDTILMMPLWGAGIRSSVHPAWGIMKRIFTAAVAAAIAIVGLTAVPAQALQHPRGCSTDYDYETSFAEVTELKCSTGYTGGGDFTKYKNLTRLDLANEPYLKLSSLPKMPASLEDLRIGDLTSSDWSPIYTLPNLLSLETYGSATSPDLARFAKSSPHLESLGLTSRTWTDLSVVRSMKNMVSFGFRYVQPGVAKTAMMNQPVANVARTDINGKPLKYEYAGIYGKNTAKGVTFSINGDHTVEYTGDLYGAQAYLPRLQEWAVTQESTIRVQDYAPLHYVKAKDRDTLGGGDRVGQYLELYGDSLIEYEAYQWMRNGANIKGATGYRYKQTPTDIGKRISVKVTNKRGYIPGGSFNDKDNRFFVPVSMTLQAPRTTRGIMSVAKVPVVTGARKVNSVVKANPKFGLGGVGLKYQWHRNGKPIKGATKATYRLQTEDYGKKVTVKATASKKNYVAATKTSAAFKPAARPLAVKKAPQITGTLKGGKTLRVKPGSWAAKPSKIRYQWYVDGVEMWGATKSTFKVSSSDSKQKIKVRAWAVKPGYTQSAASNSRTVTAQPNLKKIPYKKPKYECKTRGHWDLNGNFEYTTSCAWS